MYIIIPIRQLMFTNPPVLWLKVEKPRPDAQWELIVPVKGKRIKLTEELSATFDELYLDDTLLMETDGRNTEEETRITEAP